MDKNQVNRFKDVFRRTADEFVDECDGECDGEDRRVVSGMAREEALRAVPQVREYLEAWELERKRLPLGQKGWVDGLSPKAKMGLSISQFMNGFWGGRPKRETKNGSDDELSAGGARKSKVYYRHLCDNYDIVPSDKLLADAGPYAESTLANARIHLRQLGYVIEKFSAHDAGERTAGSYTWWKVEKRPQDEIRRMAGVLRRELSVDDVMALIDELRRDRMREL